LHKQAVSGDAPPNPPPSSTSTTDQAPAEKSKYAAWKAKRGLSTEEAMTQYIAECDRQVRVYGTAAAAAATASNPQTPLNTPQTTTSSSSSISTPRGLAAIPLLCAAAAESRVAYLRRMEVSSPESSWWSRQEPLCSSTSSTTTNSITALPETLLLQLASLVERISLSPPTPLAMIPPSVLQSILWPLHNMLLVTWMGMILWLLLLQSAFRLVRTLIYGARRTGMTLPSIWNVMLEPTHRSIQSLAEPHQPLSVRLMGLLLWPASLLVGTTCTTTSTTSVFAAGSTASSVVFLLGLLMTWWYFVLVVPCVTGWLLLAALASGWCFGVIEFAGV
jgi:acyl-CoA-binding protein